MCMTVVSPYVCVPALAGGRTAPEKFDYSLLDRAEARARELCSKMTLEEKAGELMLYDYRCLGKDCWSVYTNMVCRNEIGAMMRVMSAKDTRRRSSR